MEIVNFAYPEFGIGFHSGWSKNNSSPTTKLTVTRRLKVRLSNNTFKEIYNVAKGPIPPFLVKTKRGKIMGLSSGAGSAVLKWGNSHFKIKRNGYKDLGFFKKYIPDREYLLENNGLNEETFFAAGGAMALIDAKNEIKYEKKLSELGICLPQKTVGLVKIKLPFYKPDAVALIQEIESDFRVDEFITMVLLNIFYEVWGEKCKLNLKKGEFIYSKYNLKKSLVSLRKKEKLIKKVGLIIGGIYATFHRNGFLRGIGNSWYGNEIICKDGKIGVCDLESCFSKEEVGGKEIFEYLCETDLNCARTAFYDSMNYFDNSLASMFGSILIDSFNEGYSMNYIGRIPLNALNKEIHRFLKIRDYIVE